MDSLEPEPAAVIPCSQAHPDTDINCYPPEHPSQPASSGAAAMTCHEFPDGTILELREGVELTREELDAIEAYLPTYRRAERERRAAMTPRERAQAPKAWLAAAARGVRARG